MRVITPNGSADKVLVATAPGNTLTKTTRFLPDGTAETAKKADDPWRWQFEEVEVRDYDGLFDLILDLSRRPDSIALRGRLVDNPNPVQISNGQAFYRRVLVSKDAVHGVIVDLPTGIVMIDIDKSDVVLPPGWMSSAEDWAEKVIRSSTPECFHTAGCVVQWSGSVAPAGGPAKLHLWFLLDRQINSKTLKAWLLGFGDKKVYNANQNYYTSAPICLDASEARIPDPLGEDRVFLLGGPRVAVPSDVVEIEADNDPDPVYAPDEAPKFNPDLGETYWRSKLDLIGDHEGGLGFHEAIREVCMTAARCLYDPGKPIEEPFRKVLYPAIVEAAMKAHMSSPHRAADRDDRIRETEVRRSFVGAVDIVRRDLLKAEAKDQEISELIARRYEAWNTPTNTSEEPWTDRVFRRLTSRPSSSS